MKVKQRRTIPIPVSVGNYGVLVLHDKDMNGKMKTNSVGKPKEGVGASRGTGGIGARSSVSTKAEGAGAGGAGSSSGSGAGASSLDGESPGAQTR